MKIIALFLLISGCLIVSDIDNTSYTMKNISRFLKDQVDRHQTPSVQYVFFDANGIIYEQRYGLRKVSAAAPVDASTTYNLFSITKTFTAVAVLQLVQAGKLELDKPVITWLPEFMYGDSVTVAQLLRHTSGIPNPLPLKWIHLAEEHEGFDRDVFFAEVFKAHPRLDFAPGARFRYSNPGYVILGQLIERVSGQSYESYVTQHIIEVSGAGAADLTFRIDPSLHATGYHKWWSWGNALFGFLIDKKKYMGKREGRWKPFNHFYTNGTAYGGLSGSATGLTRYAQALLQEDSPLLQDRYREMLFTESVIENRPTGMSCSWFTGALKGNRYLAHAGGGGGYYVELRVYPELGVGSVILYNRSGMTDQRILDRADAFFITEQ